MKNLGKKSLTSAFWVFSNQFGAQGIGFVVSIVLARILMPTDFGLIGMMALFISIGNSLVDSGMSSSLIRTQNPSQADYSTVFFMNMLLSLFAYVSIYFLSPWIAVFFKQSVLTDLIRVNSLVFIIAAFSIIQSTKLNKEMNFKKQLVLNIPSLILGSSLGIYLAYHDFGVWSLVWMNLTYKSIATIQLWLFSRWKPSFHFDWKILKTHWSFGYKITLSGILDTIVNNIYNVIIGKFFPLAQLGFYTRAKSMQELPVNNISVGLNKVTYPLFADIQDDNSRLKSIYIKLIQQVFFWITPLMLIAIVVAEPLFRLLLTEKWLPAVPYFQILCIAGIVMPLNTYNLNILLVKGQSAKYLKLKIIRNILIVFGALLFIPLGIFGLLWSVVITNFITLFINSYYSGKLIDLNIKIQFFTIYKIFLLSIVTFILAIGITYFIIDRLESDLFQILIITLGSFGFYLGSARLLKLTAMADLFLLLKSKNR
jgi:O-antigen/teichoic acid export membrane protein